MESKYSDVLDRFARRRRRQDASDIVGVVDRDKTLEPNDENGNSSLNPLMKSATTSNLGLFNNSRLKNSGSFSTSDRKERTPYRLTKNKTSKYLVDSDRDNTHYRTRYYEPGGSGRYRENAYDSLLNNSGSNRYNRQDRENYKSRYDPEELSTDLSSSARKPRAYGRTKTLTDLLNGVDENGNSASTSYPSTSTSTSSSARVNRFDTNNRKSLGTALQRSRTNAYLYDADPNNIQFDDEDRSSADNAAIIAALREDNNETAANAFAERIEKRKKIKNMLIKYAEDDTYDQSKNDDTASVAASTSSNSSANRRSKKQDSSGTTSNSNNLSSYKRLDGVGPLFYDPILSSTSSSYSYRKPLTTSKPSSVYDNGVINNRFLPLTKSATSSSLSLLGNHRPQTSTSSYLYQQRSRIPKTLSSFVRHFLCSVVFKRLCVRF